MTKNGRKVSYAVLMVALGSATGCVEKTTELTAAERERLTEFVGNEAPSPGHELEASFENKVELVGYDTEGERITPGEPFKVTWYWHCERPLEEGWRLFTHVADASGESRLNQDMESEIRRIYQPGRWKSGEYIRDEQTVTLPADWNSPRATFFLGFWNGPHRLQITSGPNDGENRVRALTIDVEAAEAPAPPAPSVPALEARRTTAPITVDGKLDEPIWAEARATPRFVNTMTGAAAEPNATAKLLWDDRNLYVAFEVTDTFLKSSFTNRDDHLWEQDTVEVMIDPDGDANGYFEIQVAPTGKTFETRYETARQPGPFGHVDWNPDMQAVVERRGTANDTTADEGYTVELAIPWTAFAVEGQATTPPAHGATWRVNLFVMDAQAEGEPRAVAWSPPRVGDFHTLDRFGRARFLDPAAAPAAPTAPEAAMPVEQRQIQLNPALLKQLQAGPGVGRQGALGFRAEGRDQPAEGEPTPTMENPRPAYPTMGGTAPAAPTMAAPTMAAPTGAAPAMATGAAPAAMAPAVQ